MTKTAMKMEDQRYNVFYLLTPEGVFTVVRLSFINFPQIEVHFFGDNRPRYCTLTDMELIDVYVNEVLGYLCGNLRCFDNNNFLRGLQKYGVER